MGIQDLNKKYNIDELIKGDVFFCATAVTNGDIVDGIIDNGDSFIASTYALHKKSKTNIKVKNTHKK